MPWTAPQRAAAPGGFTIVNSHTQQAAGAVYLSGRRLFLARAVWALITMGGIGLFLAGLPFRYRQLLTTCAGADCAEAQLTQPAMQALHAAGIAPATYAAYLVGLSVLVAVVHCAVGLFIAWRQSRERMALLASLWLITLGLTLTEGEVRALAAAYPALQLPAVALIWLGGVVLLVLFMFTFPDGRFVPGWSRWLYPLVVLAMALTVALQTANGGEPLVELWGLMILGGIAAQVYRYLRVSRPLQRQQTKWVMAGLLLLAVAVAFLFIYDSARWTLGGADLDGAVTRLVDTTVASLAFLAIPLTVGFSVLRYRLWDTDRLINRTLVYGLLTAVLALLYFGSVLILQQAIQALTGQRSPLAIVASTLFIAALFSPLRRRLQALIDRRFYRRRYDAARTLARFAAVTQNEVDLTQLSTALLTAVEQTMQPAGLQLWLTERDEPPRRSPR